MRKLDLSVYCFSTFFTLLTGCQSSISVNVEKNKKEKNPALEISTTTPPAASVMSASLTFATTTVAVSDTVKTAFYRGYESSTSVSSPSALESVLTYLARNVFYYTLAGVTNTPIMNSTATGWQPVANPHGRILGRLQFSSSVVGTKFIFFGGQDNLKLYRNDVWSYDSATAKWTLLKSDDNNGVGTVGTNFPARRVRHAQTTVGNAIVIFGGYDDSSTYHNDVWSFDTSTATWTRLKADDNGGVGVVDVNYPKKRDMLAAATVGTKVIVIGGNDSVTLRNDVWAFDTSTNTWALLKADDNAGAGAVDVNYPRRRYGHSLSAVGSKVILFGGVDSLSAYRNDVWEFDAGTNTWGLLKPNDNGGAGVVGTDFPSKRHSHSQFTANTKIVVLFGYDVFSALKNDIWSFDTVGNSWALVKDQNNGGIGSANIDYPVSRFYPTAGIIGSKIYIFGGQNANNQPQDDHWSFDMNASAWNLISLTNGETSGVPGMSYPAARVRHSQSVVDGKLVVFGGFDSTGSRHNDVWSFDPSTNRWTQLKADDNAGVGVAGVNYPTRRFDQFQTTIGSKIIIYCGWDGFGLGQLNDVWSFDTTTLVWTQLKDNDNGGVGVVGVNFPPRRWAAGSSPDAIGTKVFVFGGQDESSVYHNDVWSFDTAGNTWSLLKADDNGGAGVVNVNYPRRRGYHSMSIVGSKLIVFGGSDNLGTARNDVWAFDTTGNTWSLLKADDNAGAGVADVDFPKRRTGPAQDSFGNYIAVFGGFDPGTTSSYNDVWLFDTVLASWQRLKASDNGGLGSILVNYPARVNSARMTNIAGKFFTFGGNVSINPYKYSDLWAFDPSYAVNGNQYPRTLIKFDVSSLNVASAGSGTLNIKAYAKGSTGSAIGYQTKILAWDASSSVYKTLSTTAATSLSAASLQSLSVPMSYKTSSGVMYFIVTTDYPDTSSYNGEVDIDIANINFVVPTL